jgi:hypothetical protein
MGIMKMGVNIASWVMSWGEVWSYGGVVGVSVESVVNGADVGENKARI